jgi:NADH-quinone oxidoreductase subunit D
LGEFESIIRQALEKCRKEMTCRCSDYYLPPKKMFNNMESLIYHFKIVMGEVPVPVARNLPR